jgi:hypothetical protein
MFKNKAILIFASAMLALPGAIQAQGVTPTAAGKGNTVSADQLITRYSGLAGGPANAKSIVNGLRTGEDITLGSEEKICTASQTTCNAYEQTCATYQQACTTTCVQPVACLPGQPGCVGGFKCLQTNTTCTDSSTCSKWQDSTTCKPGQSTTTCTTWGSKPTNLTFSPKPAAPMGFGNVDIALALTEARLGTNTSPTAQELKDALMGILDKRASGQGWGQIAKSYGFQLKE